MPRTRINHRYGDKNFELTQKAKAAAIRGQKITSLKDKANNWAYDVVDFMREGPRKYRRRQPELRHTRMFGNVWENAPVIGRYNPLQNRPLLKSSTGGDSPPGPHPPGDHRPMPVPPGDRKPNNGPSQRGRIMRKPSNLSRLPKRQESHEDIISRAVEYLLEIDLVNRGGGTAVSRGNRGTPSGAPTSAASSGAASTGPGTTGNVTGNKPAGSTPPGATSGGAANRGSGSPPKPGDNTSGNNGAFKDDKGNVRHVAAGVDINAPAKGKPIDSSSPNAPAPVKSEFQKQQVARQGSSANTGRGSGPGGSYAGPGTGNPARMQTGQHNPLNHASGRSISPNRGVVSPGMSSMRTGMRSSYGGSRSMGGGASYRGSGGSASFGGSSRSGPGGSSSRMGGGFSNSSGSAAGGFNAWNSSRSGR